MTTVLVAADGAWVRGFVRTSLEDANTRVVECERGQDVRSVVAAEHPDLVVCDTQIANMGGVAVTIDLHLEAGAGRLPAVPVVLLLDREADRFLAKRAQTDAELLKPVDPLTFRETCLEVMAERSKQTVQ